MRPRTVEITFSEQQARILEGFIRNKASTSHRLIERSRIVVMSAQGVTDVEQARVLGVDRQRIRRWRQRWGQYEERLAQAEREGATDKDFIALIRRVLNDAPRPGGPTSFSAEPIAQIIAVACEPPEDSGRPVPQTSGLQVDRRPPKPCSRVHQLLQCGIGQTVQVDLCWQATAGTMKVPLN